MKVKQRNDNRSGVNLAKFLVNSILNNSGLCYPTCDKLSDRLTSFFFALCLLVRLQLDACKTMYYCALCNLNVSTYVPK